MTRSPDASPTSNSLDRRAFFNLCAAAAIGAAVGRISMSSTERAPRAQALSAHCRIRVRLGRVGR